MSLTTSPDLASLLCLPADVRADIELWAARLAAIRPPIQAALASLAASLGVSPQTARRKYDAWRKTGWRGLINRAKCPTLQQRGLDPDLIEFFRGLVESNGRKGAPAWRKLCQLYTTGAPIPGVPAGADRTRLPRGMSYDNLMRHCPTAFELAAARIGRTAAAGHRPKLLTTRADLHVGERILFDDMWHDFKVVILGQRRPMRLLQLHAHDLFSGCQFARGLKPRLETPDGALGLNSGEMLFLVAHVLTQFGYYPDGTTLMVEHGTAAISETLERALYDLSAGKILVERSGIQGGREFGSEKPGHHSTFQQLSAFAGQYPGRGKGNFRFKAALESLGNLIHNETADLLTFPGQTGSNSRINAPEELAGREKITDQLSLALLACPSLSAQLRFPFLEATQAKWLVEQVMERINRRTDHDLEGWDGLTTIDYELPNVGLISAAHYLTLDPAQQAAVVAAAAPIARKLSPREVFDAGAKQLVHFRPEQTASLLKDTQGREVTVGHDHLITLESADISPEPLHYLAHHFAPGDKFTAVINPWSPSTAHLFDPRGRWCGAVELWQRIPRTDTAALQRQMGAAAQIEKQLLATLAARGAALTRQRIEDAQHNAAAIRGPAPTPDQRAAATAAANDILAAPSESAAASPAASDQLAADTLLAAIASPSIHQSTNPSIH